MLTLDTQAPPLVLGQAAGSYWERPVARPLRRHFAAVWFRIATAQTTSRIAIVPDGHADLIWVKDALWISGPTSRADIASPPAGTTVVGLRFLPGAAPPWLRVSATELLNVRIPLTEFPRSRAPELLGAIGETSTPAEIAERLEAALLLRAESADSPEQSWIDAFELLRRGNYPTGELTQFFGSYFGTSERTLRRSSERVFGYGLKTLDRIMRIQRFIQYAGALPALGIADLSFASGYADQAHLSRDARYFTGLTPSEIKRQVTTSQY